jgi:hypothetical protein
MTDRDYQMILLGMVIGDLLLLSAWWVFGWSDRRKARRESAADQAEAQAALDAVTAKVAAMEARR